MIADADTLLQLILESKKACHHTTTLLQELDGSIGEFASSRYAKNWINNPDKYAKLSPLGRALISARREGKPGPGMPALNGSFRLGYYDISKIRLGNLKPLILKPLPHFTGPELWDASKPPWLRGYFGKYSENIKNSTERYLGKLLTDDLLQQTRFAVSASCGTDYVPVVSIDYFSGRGASSNSFHKDTTGSTLFVALHYLNPEEMIGPEILNDRWPLCVKKSKNDAVINPPDAINVTINSDVGTRPRAPWSIDSNREPFWPKEMLNTLSSAREKLINEEKPEDRDTVKSTTIEPYGIVSFVDELVYHKTPHVYKRKASDHTKFRQVKNTEIIFELPDFSYDNANKDYRGTLKRELSGHIDKGTLRGTFTGGMTKRSFVRVWISIKHKDWFEENVI